MQDHRSGRDPSPPGYVTVPLSRWSRTDVERHGLAAAGTFSPPDRAISLWPGRRADWHMWIMDVSGDALLPRRYLDEYEKRVFELHRCVERAREHNADAMRQAAEFLLDAADAHEQAAMAYELAEVTGTPRPSKPGPCGTGRLPPPGEPRQRHWHLPYRRDASAMTPRPHAAIPMAIRQACRVNPMRVRIIWACRAGTVTNSSGIRGSTSCPATSPIERSVPRRRCYCSRSCCSPPQPGGEQPSGCQRPVKPTGVRPMGHLARPASATRCQHRSFPPSCCRARPPSGDSLPHRQGPQRRQACCPRRG